MYVDVYLQVISSAFGEQIFFGLKGDTSGNLCSKFARKDFNLCIKDSK